MRLKLDRQVVNPSDPPSGQIELFSDIDQYLSTLDSSGTKRKLVANQDVAAYEHFRQVTALTGQYHIAGLYGLSSGGTAVSCPSNTIITACPFTSIRGGTINEMGVRMGTGVASSMIWMGIYNTVSDIDLRPNILLWSTGMSGAASAPNLATANPNFAPNPEKMYWIAFNVSPSHTPSYPSWFACSSVSPAMHHPLGSNTPSVGRNNGYITSTGTGAYDGLPPVWPSGDTQSYNAAAAAQLPIVYFRYGS
jgi:hypothetical protein